MYRIKRKWMLPAGLLLLAAAALAGLSWQVVRQARTLEVETPDLARLEDGVYQGEWSIPPVTAGVEVTMEDGRIAVVQLVRHDHGLGGGAESLPQAVMESQSLELDAVSGATVSSKCILKAVETALRQGG